MYFLITYDRDTESLIDCESFIETDRDKVFSKKLHLDDLYAERPDVEIGIFQSRDEKTFKRTHARYFFTASDFNASELVPRVNPAPDEGTT